VFRTVCGFIVTDCCIWKLELLLKKMFNRLLYKYQRMKVK